MSALAGRPPVQGAAGSDAGGAGHRVRPHRVSTTTTGSSSGRVPAGREWDRVWGGGWRDPQRQLREGPTGSHSPGPGDECPAGGPPRQGAAGPDAGGAGHRVQLHTSDQRQRREGPRQRAVLVPAGWGEDQCAVVTSSRSHTQAANTSRQR